MILERFDTWILLGILFGTMACGLLAALTEIKALKDDLKREKDWSRRMKQEADVAKADLAAMIDRDEARRCHFVRVRDDEIERLQQEIGSWRRKYDVLEGMMNRMWPTGGDANHGE